MRDVPMHKPCWLLRPRRKRLDTTGARAYSFAPNDGVTLMQYHIARNGQQAGTFSEEEVRARLQRNEFSPNDLCWTEGMADWQPLATQFAQVPDVNPGATINPYAPPQAALQPASLPAGMELATHGQRLAAAVLNAVFVGLCMVPFFIYVAVAAQSNSKDDAAIGIALVIALLCVLGYAFYNAYLLCTRGQSLPKKIIGIRIVTHPDGAMPSAGQAFWLRAALNLLIANVVPFYGLVDACFIFREDRRCIHDFIAGTQVVKGQPPGF